MSERELIVIIPSHNLEDFPQELGEKSAASLLNAFTILWHPLLLVESRSLPCWRAAFDLPEPRSGQLIIIPLPTDDQIPESWPEQARAAGASVVQGESLRESLLAAALPESDGHSLDPDLTADFFALGSVHLQLELLTRQMRNYSQIDQVQLHREARDAAQAALNQQAETCREHLQRCFEILLECRERFYPVTCYLLDLCLVPPDAPAESLHRLFSSPVPVNVLAPARDWETLFEREPSLRELAKTSLAEQRIEFLGGDDEDRSQTVLPLEATLHQLQTGRRRFQELLGVMPTTWAKRRFGLGNHLPQILDRLGYTGALHLVLDDGHYPDEEHSQIRWDGAGIFSISAFSRIPLAADSAAGLLRFASRMAETMDYDHVAGVALARWPDLRTPFYDDLLRGHRFAPVLGEFTTFANYFSQVDTPSRRSHHKAGEYLSPSLVSAAAMGEADPVSRHTRYWSRQRRFEQVDTILALTTLIDPQLRESIDPQRQELESRIWAATPSDPSDQHEPVEEALRESREQAETQITRLLCKRDAPAAGTLIVNPLSFPRKSLIEWPAGSIPPEHPAVRHRQIESDRAWALVDLPPCGFLWLPNAAPTNTNPTPGKLPLAEDLLLRTDEFEVQLSDVTGGIARIGTYRRSPNRLSQQVAVRFPYEKTVSLAGEGEAEGQTFRTWYTAMQLREWRVLRPGPLIGSIETQGDLLDESSGQVLATYRQVTTVCRGRPIIEVDLEISPAQPITGDPWTNYIGCRFAWKHEGLSLTASMQQGAQPVVSPRIEAPQYLEIADETFRTTLLTPGLPFHRKIGERMLDTLLITEGETCRRFRFSIAVDAAYPMQAQLDEFSPPLVIPNCAAPAGPGVGWFFQVSVANVQLLRILPGADSRTTIFRLLETEGRKRLAEVRCFRPPQQARQIDFTGRTINTLTVQGETIVIEVAPYEICDIEVTWTS